MTDVSVDQVKCVGCGMCTFACPSRFALDPKTCKSKIKNGRELVASVTVDASPDEFKELNAAMESCPVQAISVQK